MVDIMASTEGLQRYRLMEWMSAEVVGGSSIKRWVQREGWSPWQFSIMMARMIRDGLLEPLGVYARDAGKTYVKSYRVTDAGREWCDTYRSGLVHEDIVESVDGGRMAELERIMTKARERPGKWCMPDAGVVIDQRSRVLLRDAGFDVAWVVRMKTQDEGKV